MAVHAICNVKRLSSTELKVELVPRSKHTTCPCRRPIAVCSKNHLRVRCRLFQTLNLAAQKATEHATRAVSNVQGGSNMTGTICV
jgi:hypothetical protein